MTNYEQIKNMMTTEDVARLFNVHPSTVRHWSNTRLIKAYRIGPRGDRRFRREDVAHCFLERSIRECQKG